MFYKVRVFPGEKEDKIIKKNEDSFIVKMKEKPQQGKANQYLRQMLASYLQIPVGEIRIVKGAHQKSKIIHISP